ncbi:hypothetical protein [Anaeroselena agilis]|uniref:Uncharacterized protein n=1 Tax=Anaeroselena agilis TaxID=3063788 RepID=A0ABU3P3I6_9FIRM|nr:hypothetical protein [Selenomonadales bacterium 4137-cl]
MLNKTITTHTPQRITPDILKLCAKLSPSTSPQYIKVRVFSHCQPNECFNNVKRHIIRHGGCIQHGWAIWLWPKVMLDAEFHAVWLDNMGNYLDISPHFPVTNKILFLPDNNRVFEGRRIDNVRRALKNDPIVLELIKICEEMVKIQVNNVVPLMGKSMIMGDEVDRYKYLQTRAFKIREQLDRR